MELLALFIALQILKFFAEKVLAYKNKRFYENRTHQEEGCRLLGIAPEDFAKTLAYTQDKYSFASWSGGVQFLAFLIFLALGGFGYLEQAAKGLLQGASLQSPILVGLLFFAFLALLSMLLSLPFDYYYTFALEERHGFNKQTKQRFFMDRIKGLLIGACLGGCLLGGILWVMGAMGDSWWFWAWVVFSAFQMFALWIFPTLLAPLFNKFTPLEEGALKEGIQKLAHKVQFKSSGVFVMDASKRSTHGNAYFTGLFSEKRIVLFDNLLKILNVDELLGVLAHELGHFKLNHVRWTILRQTVLMALIFFLLSLFLPHREFYDAFALDGVSHYGAIFLFFHVVWFAGLLPRPHELLDVA